MKNLFVPWFCEKGVSLHHPLGFKKATPLKVQVQGRFAARLLHHVFSNLLWRVTWLPGLHFFSRKIRWLGNPSICVTRRLRFNPFESYQEVKIGSFPHIGGKKSKRLWKPHVYPHWGRKTWNLNMGKKSFEEEIQFWWFKFIQKNPDSKHVVRKKHMVTINGS